MSLWLVQQQHSLAELTAGWHIYAMSASMRVMASHVCGM